MWKKVTLSIFMVLSVLVLLISWVFSSMLMNPPPYRCRKSVVIYCGTPRQQGLAFEDVSFKSRDGLRLSGWWIPAKDVGRVVVFSHGRGGTRLGPMRFASALHKAGFSVLAFDYRNAGKSQRSFNSMTYFERRDLKAAVDFVLKKKKAYSVGVFGMSMGGATTLVTMAEDKRIKAAIVEGAFSDVYDVIADTAWRRYKAPRFPFVDLAMWLYQKRGGFDLSGLSAVKQVGRIAPRPLEFWHGTADHVVFPYHSKRLYKAAGNPKHLWMVPGVRHVRVWNVARKKAEKRVVTFFAKHLKKRPVTPPLRVVKKPAIPTNPALPRSTKTNPRTK